MSLTTRLTGMILRGLLRLVQDAAGVQVLQVSLRKGEPDEVPRLQPYGLSTVPVVGAQALVVRLAGAADAPACILVDDPRTRPTGGTPGDVVLYDARGHKVALLTTGVVVTAPSVDLAGTGGAAVARVGDAVQVTIPGGPAAGTYTGTITSGSAKVRAQ